MSGVVKTFGSCATIPEVGEEDFAQSEPKETCEENFDEKYDFEILFIISLKFICICDCSLDQGFLTLNCFDYDQKTKAPPDVTDQ